MGSRRLGWTAAVLTVAVVGCAVAAAPSAQQPDLDAAGAPRWAVQVLHTWDARRSQAWARGDRAALSRLYLPGSVAGSADLALLARYRRRGLVVRRMQMQLLQAAVLTARPNRIRLRVTDRLASAVAVGPGQRIILPRDTASTRTLTLRRVRHRWVLVSSH